MTLLLPFSPGATHASGGSRQGPETSHAASLTPGPSESPGGPQDELAGTMVLPSGAGRLLPHPRRLDLQRDMKKIASRLRLPYPEEIRRDSKGFKKRAAAILRRWLRRDGVAEQIAMRLRDPSRPPSPCSLHWLIGSRVRMRARCYPAALRSSGWRNHLSSA